MIVLRYYNFMLKTFFSFMLINLIFLLNAHSSNRKIIRGEVPSSALFMLNRVMPNGQLLSGGGGFAGRPNYVEVCNRNSINYEICKNLNNKSNIKKVCFDLFSDYGKSISEYNLCGDSVYDVSSKNYDPPPKEVISAESGFEYLSKQERAPLKAKIENARLSVSKFCCSGNNECEALMKTVPVNFCETEDPEDLGRCFNASYYSPFTQNEWESLQNGWSRALSREVIFPEKAWVGKISLSSFGKVFKLPGGGGRSIFLS